MKPQKANELFVYGTLHPDRAPAEIAFIVKLFSKIGTGTIRGRFYDLGDYPGVVLHPTRNDKIPGTIFTLPDDPTLFAALDAYEALDPASPADSLFIRAKRVVTFADRSRRRCWIYLYNRKVPEN